VDGGGDGAEVLGGSASVPEQTPPGEPSEPSEPSEGLPIEEIHHVTVPVTDAVRSSDWYTAVLDFEPILLYEDEDRVVDVVVVHPGGVSLRLLEDRDRARAMAGFDLFSLGVDGRGGLERWARRFDGEGVDCTPIRPAHLGWALTVTDPDGIGIVLQTTDSPSADEG